MQSDKSPVSGTLIPKVETPGIKYESNNAENSENLSNNLDDSLARSRPRRQCASKLKKSYTDKAESSESEDETKVKKKVSKKPLRKAATPSPNDSYSEPDNDEEDTDFEPQSPKKVNGKRGRVSLPKGVPAKKQKSSAQNGRLNSSVSKQSEKSISSPSNGKSQTKELPVAANKPAPAQASNGAVVPNPIGNSGVGKGNHSYLNQSLMPELPPDVTKDDVDKVVLANNMNTREGMELQVLYVNVDDSSSQLNALIGWSLKSEKKLIFQCMFCARIETTAKAMAAHMRRAHENFFFAMIKKAPPSTKLLFLHCRRCDFVCIDTLGMWIHFSYDHALANILEGDKQPVISLEQVDKTVLDYNSLAEVFPFYKCCCCDFVAVDNRFVANHCVQNHEASDVSSNYNGCYVRVLKLTKPKNHDLMHTYANVHALFAEGKLAGCQTETFVCVTCMYVSFSRILALTHHIRMHTGKYMMLKCAREGCNVRSMSSEMMVQHIQNDHDSQANVYRRMQCHATLLEKKDGELVEAFSM